MVQQLTEIDLRTQDPTYLTFGDDQILNAESNKERTLFRFISTLDAYVDATVIATDSSDPDFNDGVVINNQRPVPAGKTRELRITAPYEYYKMRVEATQGAPTEGSFAVRSLSDNSDANLQSEVLQKFKALNQGKSYVLRWQEEIADGATTSIGINNTDSNTVFIDKVGLSAGGDALVRTSIDHGSYTDGTNLTEINGRPELQKERGITATVTSNPTYSNPQAEIEGYRPGGSGTAPQATQGTEAPGAQYEIDPGQTIVFEIENDSASTNRYGFLLRLFDTVIR